MVTVIDYFQYLSLPVIAYHCLAPVLAEKNEHRLVLFSGKSEHHLDLVNTRFTPTNFDVHGSQAKVHPGARACGFRYERTYERTQPTVSIDGAREKQRRARKSKQEANFEQKKGCKQL